MSLLRLPEVTTDARLLFAAMGGGHAILIPFAAPNSPELITWETGESIPVSIISVDELIEIGVITEWTNRLREDCLSGWSEHNLPGHAGRLFRCTQ